MASSIDILKSLSSNVANPDNPIQVELAQRARLDEMKRALGMTYDTTGGMDKWGNATGSSFATGATPSDVSSLENDVSKAPYTGDAAQQALTAETVASRPDTQRMAAADFAKKMGLAIAPAQTQAAGALQVEQEKNKGLKDILGMKQANAEKVMQGMQQGGQDQSSFKRTINPEGDISYSEVPVPQQVKAQQHAAQMGTSMMPTTLKMVDDFANRGKIGVAAGPIAALKAKLGYEDPNQASMNDLIMQIKGTIGNFAYVHGAARGGASPYMQQLFAQVLNPNQDPHALKGALTAIDRWMKMYATGGASEDAMNAIHDQIEQEAGRGVSSSGGGETSPTPGGTDLGPNWHQQGGGQ
jgi:hypothetical protein